MENRSSFFKRLKIKSPDLENSLLGIYLDKTLIQQDTCTSMFILALFTIAKTWKHPKSLLTYKWIKKKYDIHVQ